MATTDARTGFRLPWSPDERHHNDDQTVTDETASAADAWSDVDRDDNASGASPNTAEAATVPAPETDLSTTEATRPAAAPERPPTAPPRARPSKFLADLTKAMQTAAEAAREETLTRFQGEAKTHIEEIHARSADEATTLRRNADEDVAAIREWSKAEIAQIREETENRISGRKGDLEDELEAHAAAIERRIERVHGAVSAFETEMAGFFERLLAEEDPTRFASMAEHLPEPPAFAVDPDDAAVAAEVESLPVVESVAAVEPDVPVEADASDLFEAPEAVTGAVEAVEADAVAEAVEAVEAVVESEPETVEAVAEPVADEPVADEPVAEAAEPVAAVEAVEAAEPVAVVEAVEAVETVEAVEAVKSDSTTELVESPSDVEAAAVDHVDAESAEVDPRLAALALTGDATDAESALFTEPVEELEEIPTIADDALAARLAGLVAAEEDAAADQTVTTRVVVTGLVSVASIASFKRHLGRLESVRTVGVTSGPEGEFVFSVSHGAELAIRDSVPTLPGFQARVTGVEDGVVQVSAHDPEAEG